MRRVLAALMATATLAGLATTPVAAVQTQRFRACFVWPYDEGCTKDIAVAIGWHVKLRATATWHAGKRVQLWQSDPDESGFHRVARLRFDENGRVTWRWDAPSEVQCCWRWKFKAISGAGDVVGVSNRLRAEAAPGD